MLLPFVASYIVLAAGSDLIRIPLFKDWAYPRRAKSSEIPRIKRDLNKKVYLPLDCSAESLNFGMIFIGKPADPNVPNSKRDGQYFKMLFDTGSSAMWVPAEGNWFKQSAPHYTSYKTTFKTWTRHKFSIEYMSKSWATGRYHRNTVCIETLCAAQQFFGTACDTLRFHVTKYDGIFGLGNYKDNRILLENESKKLENNHYSILEHILKQNNLPDMFSFYLHPNGGVLTLGGYDRSDWENGNEDEQTAIEWFRIDSTMAGMWAIDGYIFSAFGEDFPFRVGILDTGSASIWAPKPTARYIRETVNTNADGFFDCSRIQELPVLTFRFAEDRYNVTLSPEEYTRKVYGFCHISINIMKQLETIDVWILGERFLQKMYTIFDVANSRVGFVKPKPWQRHVNPRMRMKCR